MSREKLKLERPEHLTEDYELYGPRQLMVLTGRLNGIGADGVVQRRDETNAIARVNGLPDDAICSSNAESYKKSWDSNPFQLRKRSALRNAWQQHVDTMLRQASESDVLLVSSGLRLDASTALILGRAVEMAMGNVYLLDIPVPDMLRSHESVKRIEAPVNMFGWHIPGDGDSSQHALIATKGHLVEAHP